MKQIKVNPNLTDTELSLLRLAAFELGFYFQSSKGYAYLREKRLWRKKLYRKRHVYKTSTDFLIML